jgi:hydrogenase-4 component B
VAICGLPPLNGFVSELLIYLGLFRTLGNEEGPSWAAAAFAAPALAFIGALALACFVKAYAAVFLGGGRSDAVHLAHEAGPSMVAPLAVLAACCFFLGLVPGLVAPILELGVSHWAPEQAVAGLRLAELAPLTWIRTTGLLLVAAVLVGAGILAVRFRQGTVESAETWGCGYAAPTPRMQYTSSSFAQMLVGQFAWVLRPKTRAPEDLPLFPADTHFHSEVPDTVLDRALLPLFRYSAWLFSWFRILHQGSIQVYLLYLFLTLLALLLWR